MIAQLQRRKISIEVFRFCVTITNYHAYIMHNLCKHCGTVFTAQTPSTGPCGNCAYDMLASIPSCDYIKLPKLETPFTLWAYNALVEKEANTPFLEDREFPTLDRIYLYYAIASLRNNQPAPPRRHNPTKPLPFNI